MINDYNPEKNDEKLREQQEIERAEDSKCLSNNELSEHFVLNPNDWEKLESIKKEAHDFALFAQTEYLSGRPGPLNLTGEATDGNIINPDRTTFEQSMVIYNNAYDMKYKELVSRWKNG